METKAAATKTFQTLDIYLASYFFLCGFNPSLQLNNGKVVFVFPASDDILQLATNFNSDVNVPVSSFVTLVKTLRGQMLTMRGPKQ